MLAFGTSGTAWANCTVAGNVIVCTPDSPNPYTSRLGNGPNSSDGMTVNIQSGVQINTQNSAAISLRDNSTINLADNSTVTNSITVQPGQPNYDSVINGLYNTNPWNGAGPNTIEFHTGNTLNVGVGATISGNGDTNTRAEAINIIGFNNTIINRGTITSSNRPAIWFQDEQRQGVAGTTNTIDNYGTISTGLGNSSPVIGNNANGSVIFTNRTGARVVGSLQFAGGNDQLTLEAGSVITGSFEGGGGTNTLTLSGVAGSSDSLAGDIRDFQTLTKIGDGRWTLTGAVGANGGNAPLQMFVNQGTLALTGNNANFNGSVTVAAAGTLEGRAQSLPPTITDNGLVRFSQDTAGTYSGRISGTGAVEKTLGGDLTLAGTNSYSGGTTINSGTVFISTDANLGAASGGLTMNGGMLGSIANVTTARATTVGPLGGGLNTAAGTTLTHNGTITGTGLLAKSGTGTAILTGTNSYSGGTGIAAGVLQVSSDANLGAASGPLAFGGGTLRTTANMTTARTTLLTTGGGTLETVAGTTLTHSGTVSGSGALTKTGGGTLLLTGTNSYTGGTLVTGGIIEIASDASLGAASGTFTLDGGTLRITQNVTATRDTILGAAGGTVQVVSGVDVDYAGAITGSGSYTKTGGGNIFLTGASSFTGGLNLSEGSVFVNGNLSAVTGTTTVQSGARLSGSGTLGGPVVVNSGGRLSAGARAGEPAALTVGNLTLNSGSDLFLNLVDTTVGGPLNDLINVNGNLVLDGQVNVLEQQQTLGPGVYRIINYTGTLTDNGLDIGSIATIDGTPTRPLTGFSVQTIVPGQVNLINTQGLSLNYWDGTPLANKNNDLIEGGDGIWRHSGPAATFNWTDPAGAVNAPWADNQFAIFIGAPGTVTVSLDSGAVTTSGMQFGVDGYLLTGAQLTMVGSAATPGATTIRVGDGTARATATTATIGAELIGNTTLTKTDLGTLILTGANSYTGGTAINGGAVQITSDANLGAAAGGITLDGGTLRTMADITTGRSAVLAANGGTFETDTGTTLTLTSALSGAGILRHAGPGNLTLLADSAHSGGTINLAGTLQLGNGGTTGGITGPLINNGTLLVDRSNQLVLDGAILGSGSLVQAGTGTTILAANNLYTGTTTISAGTLQLGNGGTAGSVTGPIVDNATLAINRSDDFTLASAISGTGTLVHTGTGRTVLTGTNSYTGGTTVASGRLYIDGNQSAATGAAVAMSGTRLGGSGIVGGDVTIQSGATLSPGADSLVPGTLTINGNLALDPNATLLYNITSTVVGGAGNDLTMVGGNLVLDGTINVVDQGQDLGPGVYRIFNYAGALTNNGLTIGGYTTDGTAITRPLTDFIVQTVIPNQVNLINVSGGDLNYWDGEPLPNKNNNIIEGGNGTWRHSGPAATSNWTDPGGMVNAPWADSQFAIFLGAPGTVTVSLDSGTVTSSGMQFGVDGYTLTGAQLTLVSAPGGAGEATIRVGDGTTAGAGMTATIDAVLAGDVLLNKTDAGTLVLNGANTYTGGTRIEGGVIEIATDTALGSPDSRLTLDGGTLRMTASLTKTRPITIDANGGAFDTVAGTATSIQSAIGGSGALAKIGDGTLTFLADNSYTGATTISAGVLQLGNGGTAGGVAGDIVDNASLVINRSNALTLSGVIAGTGSLTQAGTGTTILTADETYTGGTTISAGTLQIGDGGTTGHVVGDILNNATLVVNRSDTKFTPGVISGTGQLIQAGTGTLVLQADNTYTGGTTIQAGTLQLGDGGAAGSVVGDIVDDGRLVFNRSDEYTYSGVITGTGSFEQAGPGKTILTATSTFTGGTTVSAGILQLGDGTGLGGLTGDVLDNATLIADWAAPVFYAGTVSGTGNVILNNTDVTILTGNSTYTGGTTLNGGRVQIGHIGTVTAGGFTYTSDGTTGSFVGDVVNNTTNGLAINRSDSFLITGVISGTGAFEQMGPGTTVFEANNTYTGGTTISAGTLQIGNGGTTGLVPGDVLDNGRLVINRSNTKILEGVVSGTGEVVQAGLGTLIINKANSYSGGTVIESGVLQISADDQLGAASGTLRISTGTLRTTADITSARSVTLVDAIGTVETAGGTTLTLDGLVSGSGGLDKTGGGTLILTGDNSYAGRTTVSTGTLLVYGDQTATTGLTTVEAGATLGGIGTIGGDVVIADGATLAPGDTPGTLTINGNLSLSSGSLLAYEFGEANVVGGALNDQTVVGGDLVLDGTLNVSISAGGAFDPGVYRVITYAGALTDNGLEVGTIPSADYYVQTSILGQVNLVNTTGLTLNYWDGAAGPKNDGVVNGGDGIWQNSAGNDNWTTAIGTPNAPFSDGAFAVFAGTAGTVTVDGSLGAITVSGMQFAADDYAVQGDSVTLTGTTATVRVGDGTAAGAGMTATIGSELTGSAALAKTDLGTLILAGANSYSGGTQINGGVLQVASDANLGAAGTGVSFTGGTLRTTADLTTARTVTLNSSGTLETAAGTTLTLTSAATGAGSLVKSGEGTLLLTAANDYAGGTTIAAGTLQLGDGGTGGSILGDIADNGALVVNRSDTVTLDGAISGTGTLTQAGTGTTILTGANSYAGGTTIAAGTLQIGDGETSGSILGDVANAGTLVFDRSDTATYTGAVTGTGELVQAGTGTTVLTGASSYTGGTTISAGTLQLGNGGTTGSITGDVINNGTLAFDRSDTATYAGAVTGTGVLVQAGTGTTVLTGASSYTGGTTISAGTLQLGDGGTTGSITGDVTTNGTLTFNRSDASTFAGAVTGTGALVQTGTGTTILTGASSYTGGTTIAMGTLQIGNGGTTGSIAGDVTNNGTLAFDRSDTITFAGIVSGGGGLLQTGSGTTILTGENSYAGGTTIAAGTLQIGDGGTSGSIAGDVADNGTLVFDRSDTVTFDGTISGTGALAQAGPGTTILTAANSYAGPTTVSAGALYVDGDQSAATGPTNVGIATIGGIGTIGGDVSIAAGGTLAPGDIGIAPGTLAIGGDLNLAPGASLAYSFGQANVAGGPFNDLTRVGGDLVLGGTLDITLSPGGSFDPGVYRVLDYGGALTNNGLALGSMPAGDFFVQTSIAQQVNLVNATGLTLAFWDGGAGPKNDGAINGGNGTWQNAGAGDNWTEVNGTVNAPWTPQAFAIFSAAPGTVTIDNGNGQVQASGMQFTSSGYVLQGGALELVGSTATPNAATIRVGDGSSLGADYVATIDAPLTGAVTLVKTDLGTLVLTGTNSHAGTQVNGGTLQVAQDASLGAAAGGLGLDGGTLRTTASFTSARAVTLGTGNGMFEPVAGTSLTLGGVVGGDGALVKTGEGTLILAGTNSYAGGTAIAQGTVQVSSDANLGAASGEVEFTGGTLRTAASMSSARTLDFTGTGTVLTDSGTTFTYNGALAGTGTFVKDGAGTWLIASDTSGYAGAGRVVAGTLAVDGVLGGTLAVETAGRLEGNGQVANVTNAGTVAPGRGAIGTLTIGDYMGANGALEIEAVLGDDASPADRLVVTGATAGATRVDVVNLGGTGGPTTEGIKIIDVLGASNGNFVLNGDYVFQGQQAIVAGAFGYRLYKNGIADPADGDWYLRSSLLNPPTTPEPPSPIPVPPLYQPGVPVYEAYPQTLLAMNGLPTLQQRVGNRSWAGTPAQGGGIWGRMESSRDRPQAEFSTAMADRDVDRWQGQIGTDVTLLRRADGSALIAGIAGHYGKADAAIRSVYGNGSIDTRGYGVSASLTWYGPQGFYVDGQAKLSWYDSDLNSALLGKLADGNKGSGHAFSVEVGKRSPVGASLSVTPQIQMVYSKVVFDRFTDPNEAVVSRGLGDSLKTRWGISLDHQTIDDKGRRTHLYGVVNLSYEWLEGTRVDVSGTPVANRDERLWGELGLGGSYSLDQRFTLYTEVSANTALKDFGDSYSLKGTVGLRVGF